MLLSRIAAFMNARSVMKGAEADQCSPGRQFQRRIESLVEGMDGVTLKLMIDGDEGVFLSYLQVAPSLRRQKIATKVLDILVASADDLGVFLVLNAAQMDYQAGPNHEDLVAIYERYGFREAWDYQSPCTEMFNAKRDGTWTRMVRPATAPAFVLNV